jgi:hypothetical protein
LENACVLREDVNSLFRVEEFFLPASLILKIRSSKGLAFVQTTWQYNPEDSTHPFSYSEILQLHFLYAVCFVSVAKESSCFDFYEHFRYRSVL